MEPRKLLLVDDDDIFCTVMQTLLTDIGYEVVTETDGLKVMDHLLGRPFDVVLLDLVMPSQSGLELIEEIREHNPVMPIIVVTGYGSAEMTVEAMSRGATDFVTKPVEAKFLDLRIRRAFDLEHARRLAKTDGLTGLYNHRYLQERLQQEVERAERYGRPLSVVMADLDAFKVYNDTHGHPQGDEALIAVANVLRLMSRASDIVARYGGEEFTIILPETPFEEAKVVGERIRQQVEALGLLNGPQADGGPLTLSLGVASFSTGESKQELIEAADVALYTAKRAGKNQVCFAPERVKQLVNAES